MCSMTCWTGPRDQLAQGGMNAIVGSRRVWQLWWHLRLQRKTVASSGPGSRGVRECFCGVGRCSAQLETGGAEGHTYPPCQNSSGTGMTDLTGFGPVTVTDRDETACPRRSTLPPSLSSLLIVQAECPQTETVALAQSSLDINAAARSFVGGVFLVAFCEETAVEQQN